MCIPGFNEEYNSNKHFGVGANFCWSSVTYNEQEIWNSSMDKNSWRRAVVAYTLVYKKISIKTTQL